MYFNGGSVFMDQHRRGQSLHSFILAGIFIYFNCSVKFDNLIEVY